VLDVKTGSGAFMKTLDSARDLAQTMVRIGAQVRRKTVAVISDMDQPLGNYIGNALEVAECIEIMRGGGPDDLRRLCVELSAWMLLLGGRVATLEEGARIVHGLISGGQALEKFRIMVRLQGGDERVADDPGRLPQARNRSELLSPASGHVAVMDCEKFGVASCVLGGGREKKEDTVDPAVGIILHKKTGDSVKSGEPLCTLHYNSGTRLDEARGLLAAGYQIAPGAAPEGLRDRKLVRRVIGRHGASGPDSHTSP